MFLTRTRLAVIILVVALVGAAHLFAQDAKAFGGIELRNGAFYYHDASFAKARIVVAGTTLAFSAIDCASITYADDNGMKVITIMGTNGVGYEIPAKSIGFIITNIKDNELDLALF